MLWCFILFQTDSPMTFGRASINNRALFIVTAVPSVHVQLRYNFETFFTNSVQIIIHYNSVEIPSSHSIIHLFSGIP